MNRLLLILGLMIVSCSASAIPYETITFEDYAPIAGLYFVDPGDVFAQGMVFDFTPGQLVIYDSWPDQMIGNNTAWLGFSSSELVTMRCLGSAFHLASLLIGPTSTGGIPIDMTITGYFWGGGIETEIFTNLMQATLADLNWEDLLSVEFSVSGGSSLADAGIDNLLVNRVPAPASLALLVSGLLGLGWSVRA